MVKDSDKWKDYPEKDSKNGDEESDIDVHGEKNRVWGGTFSVEN